jgi:hypothetical protein
VCAASGDGIKESLWALIELISVSRSNGKGGTLWLSSSTNPRWKKVCPIFVEGLAHEWNANQHNIPLCIPQRWCVLKKDELRYYKHSKDVLFGKQAGGVKLVRELSLTTQTPPPCANRSLACRRA